MNRDRIAELEKFKKKFNQVIIAAEQDQCDVMAEGEIIADYRRLLDRVAVLEAALKLACEWQHGDCPLDGRGLPLPDSCEPRGAEADPGEFTCKATRDRDWSCIAEDYIKQAEREEPDAG